MAWRMVFGSRPVRAPRAWPEAPWRSCRMVTRMWLGRGRLRGGGGGAGGAAGGPGGGLVEAGFELGVPGGGDAGGEVVQVLGGQASDGGEGLDGGGVRAGRRGRGGRRGGGRAQRVVPVAVEAVAH